MTEPTISEPGKKIKKPDWLRVKLPIGESYKHVRNLVDSHKLHTIFPAHWDPKLRIPRGQVVAAASIVSPKY